MEEKKVVITDLDGTLLDENYEWRKAEKELKELKKRKVPVVFCSAKTREEQRELRSEMEVNDPYIVEDGSAVVIPESCELIEVVNKLKDITDLVKKVREDEKNREVLLVLGDSYEIIVKYLRELKERGAERLRFYAAISEDEVSRVTGLSREKAKLAKEREFSETLVEWGDEELDAIRRKFNVEVGGRFAHVYGKEADKGKAVEVLKRLYRKAGYDVWTLGIGNHYTDIPMLKAVEQPAIVKNPDGWIDVEIPKLYKAKGIATEGWVEVVRKFLLD